MEIRTVLSNATIAARNAQEEPFTFCRRFTGEQVGDKVQLRSIEGDWYLGEIYDMDYHRFYVELH